eukprot:scaffold24308_cov34-Attheya_sp.AAC.1
MTQNDRLEGHILLSTLVTNTTTVPSNLAYASNPTRENRGPKDQEGRDGAGPRAAGSRKRPTGPHYYNSLVSGIYVRPSELFNTGYRHGANGEGKEPRSVPVLRLTFCFAALANKKGKEDSAVECHFGRRDFGLRGTLRLIYATTGSNYPRQLSLAYVESA